MLQTDRVVKSPAGLDLPALLDQIEAEMKTAPGPKQWSMNHCLAEVGIRNRGLRARATAIDERLEVLKDYPASPGCTPPFAPVWIAEMVRRQKAEKDAGRVRGSQQHDSSARRAPAAPGTPLARGAEPVLRDAGPQGPARLAPPARRLQLLELSRQHPIGDAGRSRLELAESLGAAREIPADVGLYSQVVSLRVN